MRRDMRAWDRLVDEGRTSEAFELRWAWPDLTPPLKYTDTIVDEVSKHGKHGKCGDHAALA